MTNPPEIAEQRKMERCSFDAHRPATIHDPGSSKQEQSIGAEVEEGMYGKHMDEIIEIGNVKIAPAHNGYFLTIKTQPYGLPIEHTWRVTKEELIELYHVLMLLTEHEMPYLYERCTERKNSSR